VRLSDPAETEDRRFPPGFLRPSIKFLHSTPTGSHIIAQGKRNGVAVERHPGLQQHKRGNPKALYKTVAIVAPFPATL
jgi:hypothetical protein